MVSHFENNFLFLMKILTYNWVKSDNKEIYCTEADVLLPSSDQLYRFLLLLKTFKK